MPRLTDPMISVGFDKNGEVDFAITGSIMNLSLDQMNELRRMIPVAIAQAEGMWKMSPDHEWNQPAMTANDPLRR